MIRSTTRALFRCALSCALALASIALCFSSARAATLAMEAVYDPTNGNISVRPYDSDTDTPWTGADPVFGLFDINSSNGLFSGAAANLPAGSFVSGDTDTRINFAFISGAPTISYASPWDFGNVAAVGLTDAQLDNMISTETGAGPASFTWSLGAGNPNQIGRVVSAQPVPEPSGWALASIGIAVGGWWTFRRNRRRLNSIAQVALAASVALVTLSTANTTSAATLAMEAVYNPSNGNISVRPYDSDTDTPWTGADPVFGLFDINSSNGLFSGDPANLPTGSFVSGDTDTRINFAFISGAPTISDASPWDLGNVAAVGLTDAQLDNMISTETGAGPATFTWSLGAGNPNQIGRVVSAQPVPEPSTIVTLAIGGIAGLGFTARRRLRKRAANASATRALAA